MHRYKGFYIDRPCGNNVFSYEERENKKKKNEKQNSKGKK